MARRAWVAAVMAVAAWGPSAPAQPGPSAPLAPVASPSPLIAPDLVAKPSNYVPDVVPVGPNTYVAPKPAPKKGDHPTPQTRQLQPFESRWGKTEFPPLALSTPPELVAPVAPVAPAAAVEQPRPILVEQPAPTIQPVVALFRPDPVPMRLVRMATLPSNQMADEIGPFVRDLSEALRPSLRERAATALAEGRYGWRPEVKELLATAAKADPAPSVRAHCVGLLSKLGYHATPHLEYLVECRESPSAEVRDAATAALGKLAAHVGAK